MSVSHGEWTSLQGAEVAAVDDAGTERTLVLESVTPARDAGDWLSYTLTFRGPADFPVVQQTHRLSAADLEEPVFLVPVARDADGVALEAVFAQHQQNAPRARTEED